MKKGSQGQLQPLLAPVNDEADILLLCGDLTDYGLEEEALILAGELKAAVHIPIVAVLGNHDYESGQQDSVCRILTDIGVKVLVGEACEIEGIGIAGAKGFAGGFGRATLGAWGEPAVKRFVQEALDEAISSRRRSPGCEPSPASRCCTTRPFARPSRGSRWRSSRFSARAAWRSR